MAQNELFLAANAAVAVALIALIALQIRDHMKKRLYSIRLARTALRQHYDEMERIIDDPAFPREAAEFLAMFNYVITNKDAAVEMVRDITNPRKRPNGEANASVPETLIAKVEALRSSRPDLVNGFYVAFGSGVVAVFHRWPANEKKLSAFLALTASDTHKEVQLTSKFVKSRPNLTGQALAA